MYGTHECREPYGPLTGASRTQRTIWSSNGGLFKRSPLRGSYGSLHVPCSWFHEPCSWWFHEHTSWLRGGFMSTVSWLPNDVRGAFTNTLRGLHEHCSWWLNEHCSVASHTRFSVRGCPNTVRGFQTMFVVASRTTSWPPRTWFVASPRAAACMFDFQA